MLSLQYIDFIKKGKTGWIQALSKEELIELFKELKLSSTDLKLEDLRNNLRELIRSGTLIKKLHIPKTAMSFYGQIQAFNGENFDIFREQLECIILLNEVADEKKTPLLLTHLHPKVLETLNHLCSPVRPIKKEFKEILSILETRYIKSTSTTLDRSIFRSRNQKDAENIEEYIIELKKLAKRCEFKDTEDQVKEKFIDGVREHLIKFELLKSSELPLEKIVQLARNVEGAMLQSGHTPSSSQPATDSKDMFQYKSWKKKGNINKAKFDKNNNDKVSSCSVCGKKNHTKFQCSLKTKFCSECGKQGHIFKMCRVRNTKTLDVIQDDSTIEKSIQNLFVSDEEPSQSFSMYTNLISHSKVPPQFINVCVEGKYIQFELDTGSEVSTITLDDQINFFPHKHIENCLIHFKNFDQTISNPVGIIKNINVTWNNCTKRLDVYVVQNNQPRVLGRNWLSVFNCWPLNLNLTNIQYEINLNNFNDHISSIKNTFKEIFTPGWGNFKGESIVLKLKDDVKPKFMPVRQVPFALKEKVKLEINRLLENKRIVPVKYSEWGTPVVPILKPDGSVRLCGDYKVTLNPFLEIDHFPLPHIDHIFQIMQGGEYFCELDLKEAYLQVPLDIDSQNLTVINTELGIFKYLYLPYGISTGPSSFQRIMSNKLSNITNVIVFIDNIYMCGSSFNDMCTTLQKVLTVLKESELKLKAEKCKFFKKNITIFGYNISKGSVSILKENIEPILKLPAPENISMLRSFLGKLTYYARFLKDMATIIAPLYECTKVGKFKWTKECQVSFDLIKNKLATAQNLNLYNPNLPLILTCDASSTGVSAILSNRDHNGIVKPIAFASKKSTEREQKYSALDREALAIIFGVTKFYNYLYGRPFELETDNAALVRIFGPNKGIPKMAAKRLQHYAIFLSAFNYQIKHIPTNKNPADYLSRYPIQNNKNENTEHFCKNLEVCTNYIENLNTNIINWQLIQKETKKDLILAKILRYSYDGWPDQKLIDDEIKPYYIKRNEISIDRNCLFWGHRIIIPDMLRNEILNELHKSHFGSTRMMEIAKSYFWWPKLNEDVINVCRECKICLSYKNSPPKTPLKTWPIPPSPWYRIHADYLGPLYGKMFLIVVDSYSKWPEIFQMANIGTDLTISKFKEIFLRFGFPIHLVTDNGTSFTSQEFKNFCEILGIKHTFTPPYHPATNGAAERFVETVKANITKIVESGKSLNYALGIFLADYRATPHKSTGVSPARLMLGREIRTRFSLFRPTPIYQDLLIKQQNAQQSHKGSRKVEFKVGQKVMTRDYRKGCKPWVIGTIIQESIPGTTYYIDVGGLRWKRHVNQINSCSEIVE